PDRSGPEPPARIALAVVHERAGVVRLDGRDERVRAVTVDVREALVGRERKRAATRGDRRTDAAADLDALAGRAVELEPVHAALVELDPAQRLTLGMPDRTLAQVRSGIEQKLYQLILIALPHPEPIGSCAVTWRKPRCSSCRARLSGPTSRDLRPPASTNEATFSLALASSPARRTSSGSPATSPEESVAAKFVLNALTTGVPSGSSFASSSAAELSAGVTSASIVDQSTGFEISTTTLPRSASPCAPTTSANASYGTARTTASPLGESPTPPPSSSASAPPAAESRATTSSSFPPATTREPIPRAMLPAPMIETFTVTLPRRSADCLTILRDQRRPVRRPAGQIPCRPGERIPFGSTASLIVS